MGYAKFKELTKYFNVYKEVELNNLPNYTVEYLIDNEKILGSYLNLVDYILFTDKRFILFDKKPFRDNKTIHNIPYNSINTSAISFSKGKAKVLISLDSGYQVRLDFVKMNHEKKERLKELYKYVTKAYLEK